MHVTTLELEYLVQDGNDLILIGQDPRSGGTRMIRVEDCSQDAAAEHLRSGEGFAAHGLQAQVTFHVAALADAQSVQDDAG